VVGLLGACSDPADPGGENQGGSSAGSAGSATGGKTSGGSSGTSGTSGSSATAGKPGTGGSGGGSVAGSGGSAGSGGQDPGGQGGSDNPSGAGGEVTGEGGAGGTVSTNCVVESLHVKMSGGVSFERTNAVDDYCGGAIGGENNGLGVAFFLNPPEVENTMLASSDAYQVTPGTTGTFKAEQLSILATGAIWSMHLPDAENPLPCSMNVTKYEKVDEVKWRVAGSISCSAPLSGIGMLGGTPLEIEDLTYSIVIDTTPDQ
jgi:hypothetical protein